MNSLLPKLAVASFLAFNSRTEAFAGPGRLPSTTVRTISNARRNLMVDAALEVADSYGVASSIDSSLLLCGAAVLQETAKGEHLFSSPAENAVTETAKQLFSWTPDFQVEVITDVNHLVLDFAAFFRLPKMSLKMCAIAGRLLILFADYLPDHSFHPEELLIQVGLLGFAVKDLINDESLGASGSAVEPTTMANESDDSEWNILDGFFLVVEDADSMDT